MEWNDGELISLNVLSKLGNTCTIKYGSNTIKLATKSDKIYELSSDLQIDKVN